MANATLSGVFARCNDENRAALVGYLTAGDPDVEQSEVYLKTLASQVDVLEIGMPFSDPMADGPVIQAASERALAAACTLADVFALCRRVREQQPDIGIVLMGYANVPYAMGFEAFAAAASAAGANAVLLVDIPPEEAGLCRDALQGHDLDQIFLLSPTSSESRIRLVAEVASGFIYYVTVAGITGAQLGGVQAIAERVAALRLHTDLPICVGFGIKNAEQAEDIAQFADGVVVGSTFVSKITDCSGDVTQCSEVLLATAQSMRLAMKRKEL
jgi:tryptophan synthase alpha chain